MAWKANGKGDLPLASRERAWDGPAAEERLRSWAGGPDKESMDWPRYRQAFFAWDDENREVFGGYKLPFADVIDGELRAVPRGVFACAGGRGVDQAELPEDVRELIRGKITAYYRRMAREFEDETLRSPFEKVSGWEGRAMGRNLLGVMERKAAPAVAQTVDGRVVTGFPAVMGNLDEGGDVIEAGAFAKTVRERASRFRWLWQHDNTQPPTAHILEAREVGRDELPPAMLEQYPEAMGALMVRREYLETPRGEEILAGIRAGAVREMSIGYDAVKAAFPDGLQMAGRPVRRKLQEIRLWELSDVLWGMNPATMNLAGLTPGMDRKALAEWLESRLHLSFTELADNLFGDGIVTREERIALSGLIGDALDVFHQGMQGEALAGVRERQRWEMPEDDAPEPGEVEPAFDLDALARAIAERKRRLEVALRMLGD